MKKFQREKGEQNKKQLSSGGWDDSRKTAERRLLPSWKEASQGSYEAVVLQTVEFCLRPYYEPKSRNEEVYVRVSFCSVPGLGYVK